uniref:N-acetyltransferase domain-containing protein n=1 Tax=Enterobius vermicularis TaxID=51028 RepID=A0A0N4V2V4_ENTVE
LGFVFNLYQKQRKWIFFKEWPRSKTARANSIAKSTSKSPPMSLLLLEKETGTLVGHARLCRLLDESEFCWIESVIIDPNFRNKGVGKLLMCLVEKTAETFVKMSTWFNFHLNTMKCVFKLSFCQPDYLDLSKFAEEKLRTRNVGFTLRTVKKMYRRQLRRGLF